MESCIEASMKAQVQDNVNVFTCQTFFITNCILMILLHGHCLPAQIVMSSGA